MLRSVLCLLVITGCSPTSAAADPAPTADPGLLAVVVPRRELALTPPVAGAVAALDVGLGDRVTAGQVVARIDDQPARAELAAARSAAQAAQADARRAALDLRQARGRAQRRDELVEAGVVAREEAESARFEAQRSEAELAVARTAVDRAAARVAQLERDVAATTLSAPFAGRVAAVHQVVGARVGAHERVVTIVSDDVVVRFAAPPTRAAELTVGAAVLVRTGDTTRLGWITTVAPELDHAAQMLFAECALTPPSAPPPLRTVARVLLLPTRPAPR